MLALAFSISFQGETAHAAGLGEGAIKFIKFVKSFGRNADEAPTPRPRRGNTPPVQERGAGNHPPAVGPDGRPIDAGSRITVENFEGTIAREIQPNPNLQGLDSFARSVADVLMRTVKAAAIIVAPAGTGKSALAEHLVHLIRTNDRAVRNLHGHTVYNLDVKAITGDTKYSGEIESRLVEFRQLLESLKNEKIVFVVDELEEVLNSELGTKFLTDLKPYFTQEMGVKFIFNITPGPYNALMTDPQLVRRMFMLVGQEPDDFIVKSILENLNIGAYKKHGIKLKTEDLERIFRLSKKHPELKNPDVAITIFGDSIFKAIADISSGDARIIALTTEVEKIRGVMNEIKMARTEGSAKYFGPFYDEELLRLEEKALLYEKIINSYNESFEATEALRSEMLSKIEERSKLYQEITRRTDVDDLGDTDPEIAIDTLSGQINALAEEIRKFDPLLTAGEIKDNHIIDAAAAVLGREKKYVREVMFGGQTVESLFQDIARRTRISQNVIKSVVRRVLTKSKVSLGAKRPKHFIIVSEDPNAVKEFSEVLAKELTGVPPLNIAGTSIKKSDDISSVIGSTSGLKGSDSEGVLHAEQKKTGGRMLVSVSDLGQADKSLHDVLADVVSDGVSRSNSGRIANFEDTVIVSSVRGMPNLTDAQKLELEGLASETEKQIFYKRVLKESFTDSNPFLSGERANKIDDALLETAHIIYAQTDVVQGVNLKTFLVDKLKGKALSRAFNNQLQMDVYFSDSLVDHLFNIIKQTGANNIDAVIENDVAPALLRLLEDGKIIAGDKVTIDIAENGAFRAEPIPWAEASKREEALRAYQSDMERVRNAGEATDPLDSALEDLDGFL